MFACADRVTTPAVPAALALLLGVVAGASWPGAMIVAGLAACACWVCAAAGVARGVRPALVFCALVCAFGGTGLLLGSTRLTDALETPLAEWFGRQPAADSGRVGPVSIEGRLRADATRTAYGPVLEVAVSRAGRPGAMRDAAGGVRLSVAGSLAESRLDDWRAGRVVRISASLRRPPAHFNPGVPDQSRQRVVRGTTLLGSVKSALLVDVVRHGSAAAELAASLRAAVRRAVSASVGRYGERSAAIVTAVLIGDRAGLDGETTRRLQEAGTYHVIAISGGNIAILAGCLLLLGRAAGLRPRLLAGGVIAALAAYGALVGHEASVARATTAAVVVIGAGALDHRTPSLNVLAVVAIGILVASPLSIFDAGFVLTFGATAGIILGASPTAGLLRRLPARWIDPDSRWVIAPAALLAATLSAEAALLPVGAALFGRVSLAGLALNFLAIPLMTVTQLAGMAAVGLAPLPVLAGAAGWVAHAAATGLVESTRLLDVWPWLVFRTPPPAAAILGIYYGALAAWIWLPPRGWVRVGAPLALAVSTLWIVSAPARPALAGWPPAGWLRVTFLDVGQADATLIQTPDRWSLLVDAGGALRGTSSVGSRILAPALWALGVRRLDAVAITHADPDHVGGLASVLRDFRPREVWEGVPVPDHLTLQALRRQAEDAGIGWRRVTAGDRVDVGVVALAVLHPPSPDWERVRVRNDDSVVLDLRYGNVAVLLTGDVGSAVEGSIAAAIDPAPFRVVKIPHHGSAGSSSPVFVAVTAPCLAIVSAGRANPFGHPAPEVVARYREAGAVVVETGRHGAVTVETDGRIVRVRTADGRRWHWQIARCGCHGDQTGSGAGSPAGGSRLTACHSSSISSGSASCSELPRAVSRRSTRRSRCVNL